MQIPVKPQKQSQHVQHPSFLSLRTAINVQVRIAMVGKYTNLSDAYLSVIKSLQHACLKANRKLDILWVEASDLEDACKKTNAKAHEVWFLRIQLQGPFPLHLALIKLTSVQPNYPAAEVQDALGPFYLVGEKRSLATSSFKKAEIDLRHMSISEILCRWLGKPWN